MVFMFAKGLKIHFRFITLHYVYIILAAIIGSVILFPAGNLAYVDALFFACGSATQSGLNTIDINQIYLYQQIVLHLIPIFCNPIFIHSTLVLLRIYWFEKKFGNVVAMSKEPSKARTISMQNQRYISDNERGIRGREIKVLHANDGRIDVTEGPDGLIMRMTNSNSASRDTTPDSSRAPTPRQLDSAQGSVNGNLSTSAVAPRQTGGVAPTGGNTIQFDDALTNLSRADDDLTPHIAFVESQRARPSKALRIPGPREFERGEGAIEVDDEGDGQTLGPVHTRDEQFGEGRKGPTRSYSFAQAATNASSVLRMRKLPTMDTVLPHATTALSNAFTMGNTKPLLHRPFSRAKSKEPPPMPYLSYQPTIGRNSKFVDLDDEQRDELGGIEYRSLKLLLKILMGYMIGFHALSVIFLVPWVQRATGYNEYIKSCGLNPVWWAIFTAQSAFNDVGFTLTPDSMLSFYDATWPLVCMTFLIVIGNTGFPCMLRFIIWVMFKIAPKNSSIKESLNFLLDHPRRCFTLLFPSRETWVLFTVLLAMNVADVVLFIVLDINDPEIAHIKTGHRIMDAIFQAASTRTAGFSVVNLADVHPAVQVSYMIMMYISIFPIAISVRRTNVYEEQSLGIYTDDDDDQEPSSAPSYVGTHLRKQLSFDLWYICLGLFIITIAEGRRIEKNEEWAFTVFTVLFEIVSAYGTVGLSLGYPGINTSLAGAFGTVSKLVIIAMQIRGRHRGLPYEVDRAIMLPKELQDAEHASVRRRPSVLSRAPTSGTTASAYGGPIGSPQTGTQASAFGRPFSMAQTNGQTSGHPRSPQGDYSRSPLGTPSEVQRPFSQGSPPVSRGAI